MPDRKKWKAIMCISSPNHHWACQYLKDHLKMQFSKGAIKELAAALKKNSVADRMLDSVAAIDAGNGVEPEREPE